MNLKIRTLAASALVLLLGACAHHRDVRPGASNSHRVVVHTSDIEAGQRDAIEQANHFCKASGQIAAFDQEDSKYTGDMEEQNYKNVQRAAKVAKTVGGGVYVFGAPRESDIGGVVGLGGQAAESAIGKGYTVEMKFHCN